MDNTDRGRAPSTSVGALSSARSGFTSIAISFALIACLAGSGMIAQEQTRTVPVDEQPRSRMSAWRSGLLSVEEFADIAPPAQRGASRDTLKDGAIIGAVVGAAGLGALGAFICHLHREDGGPSCLMDTVRVAAIGTAIGIGAGVAVDAALTRNAGVTLRIAVRF